jgi:hypothetical protein
MTVFLICAIAQSASGLYWLRTERLSPINVLIETGNCYQLDPLRPDWYRSGGTCASNMLSFTLIDGHRGNDQRNCIDDFVRVAGEDVPVQR